MSSYHGRFLGVHNVSDKSSSRKKKAGYLKAGSDQDDHATLIDGTYIPINDKESQSTPSKTPIYTKSEDTPCQIKGTEKRSKNQFTPQYTTMSSDTHTNQIIGRMKSSGMKGKARRVVRKRPDEIIGKTPLQSSVTSLRTTTHPVTPSPRRNSTFSFSTKMSSTRKIREMKKIRNTPSSEHGPTVVDASSLVSVSNRLSSLSLSDEKRKCLSAGARRVPLGSLTKRANESQVEELSPHQNKNLLKYSCSPYTEVSRAEKHRYKEKQPPSTTILSLKDDFLYEILPGADEEFKQRNVEARAIREAKVDAIRVKLKNEKESKINEDLLDGCIPYEENICTLLHSSIDSDVLTESPHKNEQSTSGKLSVISKANDSFDSLSEHFRNIDNEKKFLKKEGHSGGRVNPMSKTLSRDDAELLFRAKALSQDFSFSGAISAFSAKRTEKINPDLGRGGAT